MSVTTKSPLPRTKIWVEERTAHHAIGVYDDVVVTAAFEGSQNDRKHIDTSARVIAEQAARLGSPVRFVFVLPDAHRVGAPSGDVRAAVQQAMARVGPQVSRAVVVIGGEGFGTAIHRAVISSLLLALRLSPRVKSFGDVPSALAFALGDEPARRERVLRFYEEELLRPARG